MGLDYPSATVSAPPSANGAHPRMEKRTRWVEVPGYPGYEVEVWTNAPQRHFNDLGSGDATRYLSALKALLLGTRTVQDGKEWDSWFDCDGEPLPQPNEETFLEAIPTELLICTVRAIAEAPSVYPNSLPPTRRR